MQLAAKSMSLIRTRRSVAAQKGVVADLLSKNKGSKAAITSAGAGSSVHFHPGLPVHAASLGPVIGLEFDGASSVEVLSKALAEFGDKIYVVPDAAAAAAMAEQFFAEIKV